MEQKLAAQHVEMQRIAIENQRLAATHTTLRQELAAAQLELHRVQAQIGAMKTEREQHMRGLMDKMAKMEADLPPCTTGYKENEASGLHPVGQNAYEDGYGVPQGHGPPPTAPPYGGGPSVPAPATAGYDVPRGPGYEAQRGPGYDATRGPSYDAPKGLGYGAPLRGAGGPQGPMAFANIVPYRSATPPARAGGGYEAPPRGGNLVYR
ncbi:hypothetical protein HHK36_029841 [Tetracentron sinense]|uniref:Uncharacterized protein n=1 Tax=Tetracentron sinense TaxID=13715 RepID=A0A834YC26_TETSI|nr:hypothetical protein HHK36_029841 [Tetracentron sinense]